MARRRIDVFTLSFLDAMTCGFGAVVLLYMVINAAVGLRAGRMTGDLRGEVNRLEEEVLEGYKDLVELKNAMMSVDEENVIARGLSARLIENIRVIQEELATFDDTTLASREHVNRLKTDLKSLEEDARRLSASLPSEETPGDKVRSFIGDGDRQYLTGLKVGGRRIFILVDASASMLGDTVVNVIRRRNLPDNVKIRADKWQQAVGTVDWLTTQIPRNAQFQIYTFNETAASVIPGTDGQWLDGSDREVLEQAMDGLRGVVPDKGTNLYNAFMALAAVKPAPDNLILLVDGLPTQGKAKPRGRTVSGKQRLKLFERAIEERRPGVPINVVLFPMEGDPLAASSFLKLAIRSGGSFMSPSEDWP
jgi:hypothetical protein